MAINRITGRSAFLALLKDEGITHLFGNPGTTELPIMHALADVSSPYAAFGLIIVALAIASFYTSISGLIKAEMFPTEVRALGVGLSYAIGNAAFGGSAEYVALWLKSIGAETNFYWYVSAICAVGLLVSLGMRDSGREGYLKDRP